MGYINLIDGGFDVQSIVNNLISVESVPVQRMQKQTSTLQGKISAFQSINTKLASLLNKVNDILFKGETVPLNVPGTFASRLLHSVFAQRTVASSDENTVTATASKGAASGTYSLTVSRLAQTQSMASGNFVDTGAAATGSGTLVLTVGTGSPVTITIDSTNNTLQGVRDAINDAKAGVTASIINDGTATPYRLVVTSDQTGSSNAFTVQDNLAGGQALNLTQKLAAQNAEFEVNGLAISKGSNTVTDVIEGVSFTLHDTSAVAASLTVGRDVDGIVTALKELVSAFNDVNSSIGAQSRYDPDTKTAGILSGDSTLRSIQRKIQAVLMQSVPRTLSSYGVLSQVGLKFNNDGSITLNEDTLRKAISGDLTGVAALFLGEGAISDGRVTYNSQTPSTQAGTYGIAITSLAQRAIVTGSQAVTNLTADENLTITHGSKTTAVSLLSGDSLSTVLAKINSALKADGASVTAADDGTGRVKIFTNSYGSSQSVAVASSIADDAGTTGFGTTAVSSTGSDIAGTINGSPAIGNGLTLTGAAGGPEEGLSVTISQTATGDYGTVKVSAGSTSVDGTGVMIYLRSVLRNITDPLTGPIHNSTDALNGNIRQLNERISEYQARLDIRREFLLNEYSRADQALRQMQVLQSSLTSQTASLSKIG